jgi:hypothetical protein
MQWNRDRRRASAASRHHIHITFPPATGFHPQRPLSEPWISVHDYLTEVAKFLGSRLQ